MMKQERTLSIIKPDAVKKNVIGAILDKFEKAALEIVAIKMLHIDKEVAKQFYYVHHERPFYNELVDFISSSAVVVLVLEGENSVSKNRHLMGATNPDDAEPSTIRCEFANSITENAVHGSDSVENANKEIKFFFSENEIFSKKNEG